MKGAQKALKVEEIQYPEVENVLKIWAVDAVKSGVSVDSLMLKNEAFRIAKELKVESFKGSKVWIYSFM